MNKHIIIILFLFIALPVNAKVLFFEDYADWQLVGTNLVIKNTKIEVINKFKQKDKCGYATGGEGISYKIMLSTNKHCLENINKNISHEFMHIYDYQNNISNIAKDWPCINGFCDEDEKLAYWFADYREDKKRIKVFYPKIYNYFNSLIKI